MAYMTVTNTLVNGNTADAGELNTNFSDVISATSDGTKDMNINALTCAGAVAFNGNMTLGNATSDTVTFTARVASSVLPSADDTYDLGSSSLQWRQLYADDITVNATTLVTDAANGRVGIGTASPSAPLQVLGESISTNARVTGGSDAGTSMSLFVSSSTSTMAGYQIAFNTGSNSARTESMLIDTNGNVGIGANPSAGLLHLTKSTAAILALEDTAGEGSGSVQFINNAGNTFKIATNTTTFYIYDADADKWASLPQDMTAWAFGSDRRLKDNITPIESCLETVLKLNPVRYDWKYSNGESIGFIAQELRELIPEAVFGIESEYDESSAEGRAKALSVGKEMMIPVLTKAIQEQQSLIEALTSRIEALEAK